MTNDTKNNQVRAAVQTAVMIKLGMDVHAAKVAVAVQIDGSLPQRSQMVARERLVEWIKRLRGKYPGAQCMSCYEAGPLGYCLHRELMAAGVTNYVVAPHALDQRGRGQKTDRLDAQALVANLDRYVGGNLRAMTVVNVPTEEQERARARVRLRQQLARTRRQLEARGRSAFLLHGVQLRGRWWAPKAWAELEKTQPRWLLEEVRSLRDLAIHADEEERKLRAELEKAAPAQLPKAIGALTWVILTREIRDWSRFKNRRQVASYTGLCPRIWQSGPRAGLTGSINKCGNRAVRQALLEAVWRLARYQPQYKPVAALANGGLNARQRRKHATAAARRLGIDLWRLATKQATAADLGLQVPGLVLPTQ